MSDETLFNLPNTPEEFGVKLPTSNLRRIDYTALEFDTIVRTSVEYIKTYYPTQFNDFVDNNGIIMLVDLIGYIGSSMSERGEVLVQESFLPSSFSEEAVSEHLQLINEALKSATPAVVDIEISVASAVATVVNIPAGISFNLTGADGNRLTFEIYRAPDNWSDNIAILPGKRGVIAFGIEGRFETPIIAVSAGGSNQSIDIINASVLNSPIFVDVISGSVAKRWKRVLIKERAGPSDEIYDVIKIENGLRVRFGDNVAGKAPLSGDTIKILFRSGGGARGRIGSLRINESRSIQPSPPASAPIDVLFRNPSPSSGGTDKESIEDAKKRAPRQAATLGAAVSGVDYAQLASGFSHPVFGSVLKAVATVRTSLNANVVEAYILASGADGPVKPSAGLKKGLVSYLEEVNVLTDEVRVMDGVIKRVNITANIIMNKNTDASIVKSQVEKAIDDFFKIDNFEMGQELYVSDIYYAISKIDGVKFVAIFDPTDDMLKTGKLADSSVYGVGMNELIVLGEKHLKFYYE